MALGRELELGKILRLAPPLDRIKVLVRTERISFSMAQGILLAWDLPARGHGRGSVVKSLPGLCESQGSNPRTAKRRGGEEWKREK